MPIKPHQLADSLKKNLAPIYFLTGDEPLQLGEMADLVRAAGRAASFTNREVFSTDTPGFNWNLLLEAASTPCIFAGKPLLDVKIPSGNLDHGGAKALSQYCTKVSDQALLVITAGKVRKDAYQSQWWQTLDRVGVICQVWPLDWAGLLLWLERRLSSRGLTLEPSSILVLASRVEGNLLAAAQEIEKLHAWFGPGQVSSQQLMAAITDNARFDVYQLADACLAANAKRAVRILTALNQEGIAAPIVIWALSREARVLSKLKWQTVGGLTEAAALKSQAINDPRKPLVRAAINRLSLNHLSEIIVLNSKADRQSKGQEPGDTWQTLQQICLLFAGIRTGPSN